MSLVVVSAVRYEAEPILSAIPDCDYIECGVGIFASTVSAQKHRSLCAGKDILYVGSCGSFTEFKNIEIIKGKSSRWSPTCERNGLSYPVITMPDLQLTSIQELTSIPSKQIVCASNVSLVCSGSELQVENIEVYSFFLQIINIVRSANVILAITNQVGENAHKQWEENYQRGAMMIRKTLNPFILPLTDTQN